MNNEHHQSMQMRIRGLELLSAEGWELEPAGGSTGEAYIARHGKKKIFVKRNSSPFLAVLSAEGIVPKLLWTKRLENGDVITAQEWVNGRELSTRDMNQPKVAQMLSKIHLSSELLDMFKRMGNEPLTPTIIVEEFYEKLRQIESPPPLFMETVEYLERYEQEVYHPQPVVCHGDMNHNNWMINQQNQLFLIDWDAAIVADPALDLGFVLYEYIPRNNWEKWLEAYGISYSFYLRRRMHWYVVQDTLRNAIYYWMNQSNQKQEWQMTKLGRLLHEERI